MTLRDIHPDQFIIDYELIDGQMQFTIAERAHPDSKQPLLAVIRRIFAGYALLKAAEEMRTAQKNYFAAKDQLGKKQWLIEAKNKEFKFDSLLQLTKDYENS